MEELKRSECDATTGGFHTSPTLLGQLEYYPSASNESERISVGECPSYFLLPHDSLRIKYLEERKKLWKQLTADICDSDGEDGGVGDGDDESQHQRQIPLAVSISSGNVPLPTNDAAKVLPEEVTTTFAYTSGNNYVSPAPRHEIMTMMQSTAARQQSSYQQDTFGSIPLHNNPRFAVGNPCQPYTPCLASRQLTPCPQSDQAAVKTKHPGDASELVVEVKKIRTREKSRDKKFDRRFEELKEYKKKHGHCDVPRKGSKLGLWVSKTRQACKKFKSLGKSIPGMHMDDDRMRRLKEIGFELSVAEVDKDTRQTSVFTNRLRELNNFRKVHGHIKVPTTGKFMSLGRWCSSVKRACRDFEVGKVRKSTMKMTSNRLEMLRAVGFSWEPQKRHRTFEEWVAQLKAFKDLHGHLFVPANENYRALSSWYQYMKKDYFKTMIAASQSMDMKGTKCNEKFDLVKRKRFEILKEMGLFEGMDPILPIPPVGEKQMISEEETKMPGP